MNQLGIAVLGFLFGYATLRVFVAKDVGIHGGGLILRIVVAIVAFALLIAWLVSNSA